MNVGKALAASVAAVALATVPAFGAAAQPVGGVHTTTASARAATLASTIASAADGQFKGWSCGYNSGRGIDPGHTELSKVATDHAKRFQDNQNNLLDGYLRNGWSSSKGRWFAWGRVKAVYSFEGGFFVAAEWSDDGGRTYHACGWGNRPSYVAYQNVATYTKAFDWVRNRSARVCIGSGGNPKTNSGGYWVGCTRWYLS
ncbi:hypothetical protein [Streptomyces sp. NPDC053069]|uniref:hypothetical protein n=1 Tax=Streptomyces sp. NPDC053069 TaxID=3365695 RepID=UPI0037D27AF2